jgi:hypothetical protein
MTWEARVVVEARLQEVVVAVVTCLNWRFQKRYDLKERRISLTLLDLTCSSYEALSPIMAVISVVTLRTRVYFSCVFLY